MNRIYNIENNHHIPYRFGFNGKENDDEINGWQDYGERMYNRLIGRFPTADPLIVKGKQYPELSPYQFASNTPMQAIDLDGLEGVKIIDNQAHTTTIVLKILYIPSTVDNEGSGFSNDNIQSMQSLLNDELSNLSFTDKNNSFTTADGIKKYYDVKYDIKFEPVQSIEDAKNLISSNEEYTSLQKAEFKYKRTPNGVESIVAEASKQKVYLHPNTLSKSLVEEVFHNLTHFSKNADMNRLKSIYNKDKSNYEENLHRDYGGIFVRNTGELNEQNIDDAIKALPEKK